MKCLNLGCGRDIRPVTKEFMDKMGGEWVLGDKYPAHKQVEKMTLDKIPYPPGTFDVILCEHVLEHVPHNTLSAIGTEWHRVLKTGGRVFITVPDMEWAFKRYLKLIDEGDGTEIANMVGFIWGTEDEGNHHLTGFTSKLLKGILEILDFKVERVERIINDSGNGEIRVQAKSLGSS